MLRSRKGLIGGIGLALAVMFLLSGCSGQPLSTREKGTGIGAVLGAGTGAIIGAAVGAPGAGAAIGGAIGGLGGYAVGNQLQNQEAQQTQTQAQIEQQKPGNRAPAARDRTDEATARDGVGGYFHAQIEPGLTWCHSDFASHEPVFGRMQRATPIYP